MIKQILDFLRCSNKMSSLDPDFFWETMKYRKFWRSDQGSSIVACVYPNEGIEILFQRPIKPSDIEDGKLVSAVFSGVKHRGGKRQVCIKLPLDRAEMLHEVLGRAIEDARAKRNCRNLFFRVIDALNLTVTKK